MPPVFAAAVPWIAAGVKAGAGMAIRFGGRFLVKPAIRYGGRYVVRPAWRGLKFLGNAGLGLLKKGAAALPALGGMALGALKSGAAAIGDVMSAMGAAKPFGLLAAIAGAVSGEGSAQSYGADSVGLRGRGRKAYSM